MKPKTAADYRVKLYENDRYGVQSGDLTQTPLAYNGYFLDRPKPQKQQEQKEQQEARMARWREKNAAKTRDE